MAHAKVVNGQPHAQHPQPGEQIKRVRVWLQNGRFGDLQLQLGWGKPLPVQGIQHHFGKIGIAQLARRDIYGHHQILGHGGAPCRALFAGFLQNKLAQAVDEVHVFGKCNRNGRGNGPVNGVVPAQQGFYACNAPLRMVALRLKYKVQLVFLAVQRAFQIIGQGVGQTPHLARQGKASAFVWR